MDELIAFWIAECFGCHPVLPVPFDDQAERDEWARVHRSATGHEVEVRAENAAHQVVSYG